MVLRLTVVLVLFVAVMGGYTVYTRVFKESAIPQTNTGGAKQARTSVDNNQQQENSESLTNDADSSSSSIDESSTEAISNPKQRDLDVNAIVNGDLSSLVGTWKNGQGATLVINADGTTNNAESIKTNGMPSDVSGGPYVGLTDGHTGAVLALFKIGYKNPKGDQSDSTKPRLIITQQATNYSSDMYFYRQ
ncbi:DUF6287 domain-containing protein [Furfurilactobacillus milii]|uniref:DUF6287 domain-containing protein n=1 Tax=Furfurilactobacillus milii TaxID=2888272 RepID=UPI001F407F38|nr:DUF6287 domain-containing protein [Furfurilactobacillus milii]MCF6418584.1 DUF6287 domain-containing protein [Furfurilactobacillus milii]